MICKYSNMSKDKSQKHLPLVVLFLCSLFSCVENVEYSSIIGTPITKSASESIFIINDAENTSLLIRNSNITHIEPKTIEYGDTIVLEELKKEVDTIVFDGGISFNGFWLYEGLMFAPFGRVIKALDLCDSMWNKILHPISFDAEVNDWKRQENVRP